MPQAKNHLTASTQAKNGSLYAVIQYKDENGKRKNKWKSLGLKEGASKAKINAAMREAVNYFEKELTEILTRSQNPDADCRSLSTWSSGSAASSRACKSILTAVTTT